MTDNQGKFTINRRRFSILAGVFGTGAAFSKAAMAQDATPPAGTPEAASTPVASPTVAAEPVITNLMAAEVEQLPPAPFTVRLLRITLQPGAITPMHTHHGPELDMIESGEVTIRSLGDAPVTRADGTEETSSGTEMALTDGDVVYFPAEVGMFFENTGEEAATMLSAVVIPVGPDYVNERITWIDGEPSLEGVSYQKLGDGLVQEMAESAASWSLVSAELPAGSELPALTGVSMMTPVSGNLSFTIDAGQVQVTRADSNMLQPNAVLGTSVSLGDADAAFFPNGVTATDRTEEAQPLTVLLMDIVPADAAGVQPAELTFNAGDGTVAGGPTEPEAGQIVTTNTENVNMRAQPSADAEVVDQLAAGIELEILDGPVDADDYTWYQVRVNEEGGSEGWMASEFLDGIDAAVETEGDGTSAETEEAADEGEDPSATPSVAGEFAVGSTVVTTEESVRLRPEASVDVEAIDALPLGAELTVTGETVEAEEYTWLPVETADGLTGFVTVDFVEPAP